MNNAKSQPRHRKKSQHAAGEMQNSEQQSKFISIPEVKIQGAAEAPFPWAQSLLHANTYADPPTCTGLHVEKKLLFFFFFSTGMLWKMCVSVGLVTCKCLCGCKKKKMEKVWGIYSESQKATHRLLFIAASRWNRENELQLLSAAPNWSLTRADKTFLGSLCSFNWQQKVMS